MSLEQFIQDKAQKTLRNKLSNVAHEFNNLIPNMNKYLSLNAKAYRDHAEANGSNLLTDCFGVDFPDWVNHSNVKSIVKEYVELLILAFGIDGDAFPVDKKSVAQLREKKLAHIKSHIMAKMESAMKEEEPETSITIKGKGITIDGQ